MCWVLCFLPSTDPSLKKHLYSSHSLSFAFILITVHLSYSLLNSTIIGLIIGQFSFCLSRTTSTTSSQLWPAPIFPNTSFTHSTSDFPVLFFRLKIIILFFLVSSSLVLFISFLITYFFTIISDSTFSNL